MPPPVPLAPPSLARTLLLALVGWTVVAVLFFPQFYALAGARVDASADPAIRSLVSTFLPWVLLTPLVLAAAARWPLAPWRWRHLGVHLGLLLATMTLHLVAKVGIDVLLQPARAARATPARLLLGLGATDVLIYGALVALGTALHVGRQLRERELRLARAELDALRAQLQPHFLFNTLNAIAELGYQDAARAERVTLKLSALLRHVLEAQTADFTTLRAELLLARDYLDLQQVLLEGRLQLAFDVPEPLLEARVPTLCLQPLLENAVRHGIAPQRGGGTLAVAAAAAGDALQLTVTNTGAPLAASWRDGTGLGNTRARIAALCGADARLELAATDRGTRALLHLPGALRGAAAPTAATTATTNAAATTAATSAATLAALPRTGR